MDLIAYAAHLGRELDHRYNRLQYNTREFHHVASEVLTARRSDLCVLAADVVAAAMSSELPWQSDVDSSFGEPAITLYAHPRFRIEALCWRNSTTSIHQHQFAGAFLVLCGSSLQTLYQFAPSEVVSESFLVGRLMYRDSRILNVGDIEPIELGERLIHSVFHLETPSITLVARTHYHVSYGPQFRYEPPCLAYDPFAKDYHTAKRLQIIEYLCDVQPADFERSIADLLRRGNIPLAFAALRQMRSVKRVDRDVWARLFDVALEAHGPVMAMLRGVFDRVDRERNVVALRRSTTDPALRYFMGLLLNLPSGRDIRRAVEQRVGPQRAVAQMVEWIDAIKMLASSREPLTEIDREVLQAVLSADGDPYIAAFSTAAAEQVEWRRSYERLRTSVLLRCWFDGGSDPVTHERNDVLLTQQ